jgi:hypothetical protein
MQSNTVNQTDLHLRSSKDRSDVSIEAQHRELTALAKPRGLVVADEFADAVESGRDEMESLSPVYRKIDGVERGHATVMRRIVEWEKEVVEMMSSLNRIIAAGYVTEVIDTVHALTGSAPRTLAAFTQEHAEAWS